MLSFLSSHRLHATHRPWIDPLPVQLDLLLHESPREMPEAPDFPAGGPVGDLAVEPGSVAPEPPPAV